MVRGVLSRARLRAGAWTPPEPGGARREWPLPRSSGRSSPEPASREVPGDGACAADDGQEGEGPGEGPRRGGGPDEGGPARAEAFQREFCFRERRKMVRKFEISQHTKYTGFLSGKTNMKRRAVGTCPCASCVQVVIGGTWTYAITVKSAIRGLMDLKDQ
ncbi:60S ribosomal protein L37a [Galemys pyrenaicus]|uniref:60S ribosomal protein L37a n=1 Tax=Galemys pyrenaicus TaxID=202257 RepID=A0A8J6A6I7_GALPY|nr:60S ribosomal protein L37a [Galemys pyrenaicus]